MKSPIAKNRNIQKTIYYFIFAIVSSGCANEIKIHNTANVSTECNITLSDNRMNAGLVDLKGDLPTTYGYVEVPFSTIPKVSDLLTNQICSDKQLANSGYHFELERFYCDAKTRFTYAKGRVELQLSYKTKDGDLKRTYIVSTVNIPKDTPLLEVCSMGIEKVTGDLNSTIKRDASL